MQKNPSKHSSRWSLLVLTALITGAAYAQDAPAQPQKKADPAAYEMLKKAHDSRHVLPPNFPGFTANVTFNNGERDFTGTVRYKPGEESQVKFEGLSKDDAAWAEDQVLSIIGHRRGGDFAKGDGRHPLTFGAEESNSFGRLINLNDQLNSSYRVKGNKVTEVTRIMGDTKFTISVLQTTSTPEGKYLPLHFVVSYRDIKKNTLELVQAYRDTYTQIGGASLPLQRIVLSIEPDKVTPRERTLKFSNLKLLSANP